jgi:hypothetical protein
MHELLLRTGVAGGVSAVKRLSGSYNASELFQTAPVHTQCMYNMDANRSDIIHSAQCGYSFQRWPPLGVKMHSLGHSTVSNAERKLSPNQISRLRL